MPWDSQQTWVDGGSQNLTDSEGEWGDDEAENEARKDAEREKVRKELEEAAKLKATMMDPFVVTSGSGTGSEPLTGPGMSGGLNPFGSSFGGASSDPGTVVQIEPNTSTVSDPIDPRLAAILDRETAAAMAAENARRASQGLPPLSPNADSARWDEITNAAIDRSMGIWDTTRAPVTTPDLSPQAGNPAGGISIGGISIPTDLGAFGGVSGGGINVLPLPVDPTTALILTGAGLVLGGGGGGSGPFVGPVAPPPSAPSAPIDPNAPSGAGGVTPDPNAGGTTVVPPVFPPQQPPSTPVVTQPPAPPETQAPTTVIPVIPPSQQPDSSTVFGGTAQPRPEYEPPAQDPNSKAPKEWNPATNVVVPTQPPPTPPPTQTPPPTPVEITPQLGNPVNVGTGTSQPPSPPPSPTGGGDQPPGSSTTVVPTNPSGTGTNVVPGPGGGLPENPSPPTNVVVPVNPPGPPQVTPPPVVPVTPPPTTTTATPPTTVPTTPTATLPKRDYYEEGKRSTDALVKLAPDIEGLYKSGSANYSQADLDNLNSILGKYGQTADLLTNAASKQTVASNAALRAGNFADVAKYAPEALAQMRASNPELWASIEKTAQAANITPSDFMGSLGQMFASGPQYKDVSIAPAKAADVGLSEAEKRIMGQGPSQISQLLQQQALSDLQLGRGLSAQEVRDSQQAARDAWSSRGLVNSTGAVAGEILNRDAIARQREAERRAFAQGIDAYAFDQSNQVFNNALNLSKANQIYAGLDVDAQKANQNAALNAFGQRAGLGLSLDNIQSGMKQQNFANQAMVSNLYNQNKFDPFATVLGAQYGQQTQNQGTNTDVFNQAGGVSSGKYSNQYVQNAMNPFNTYSQDVEGSNFNAEMAAIISKMNNDAAVAGAKEGATAEYTKLFTDLWAKYFGPKT